MKKLILFLSLLGLLHPLQGFCQYTVTNLDTAVWGTNWQVNFDIDNDGTDDLYFYQGGWPIDSYVMMGVALSDSIHFSQNTLNSNSFNFTLANDSLAWIAETYVLFEDQLNSSPGGMNIVKYVGYYKTISPTDSIFGYFTIKPYLGPYLNTSFGDTLFIYNHVQATSTNTPLDAGVNCFFDLDITSDSSCVSCIGGIEALSYGGFAPFNYLWSTGETTPLIDSLCTGQYSVTITDSLGCTWTDSVVVGEVNLSLNFSVNGNGGCGSYIESYIQGGTPPYIYNWSTGSTNSTSGGVCAGWHVLTVTDSLGCTATDSSYVVDDTTLTTQSVVTQPASGICAGFGNCQGIVSIYVYNGTPPYTIQTSSGFTDTFTDFYYYLNNLCEGSVTYTITDSAGYTYTGYEYVPAGAQQNVQLVIQGTTPPSCSGCSDGEIHLSAANGGAPYLWTIDSGTTLTGSGIFTGLPAGIYYPCVIDANGCWSCDTIIIMTTCDSIDSELPAITISSASCQFCDDGIIDMITQGCGPTHLFSIDSGLTWQTTGYYDDLLPGYYDIGYSCANGCATYDQVLVGQICGSITETITHPDNCVPCNGSIGVDIGTSYPNATYLWSNGDTISTISNLCEGIYNVLITDDSALCTWNESYSVIHSNPLQINALNLGEIDCFGGCNGSIEFEVLNGQNEQVAFVNGNLTNTGLNQYLLSDLCDGIHTVTVTDSTGCVDTLTQELIEPDSLYFTFNQLYLASCTFCNDGSAELIISGGSNPYVVDWSGFGSASTFSVANDLLGGSGIVCVTDASGCQFCDSVTVDFIDDSGLETSSIKCEIYPNPADDKIAVQSTVKISSFEILDPSGKLISSTIANSSEFEIDISILPSGVYLIRMASENYIIKQKLVVY